MKRMPQKPMLAKKTRDGKKTETRRLINPQPKLLAEFVGPDNSNPPQWWIWLGIIWDEPVCQVKPAYQVGDIVGIAEAWRLAFRSRDGIIGIDESFDRCSGKQLAEKVFPSDDYRSLIRYEADTEDTRKAGRFRQGRFLPDAFVRTKVRITGVFAEQLNVITEEQAIAEGIEQSVRPARELFMELWDSIHPEAPWISNPWVWRYTYELAP